MKNIRGNLYKIISLPLTLILMVTTISTVQAVTRGTFPSSTEPTAELNEDGYSTLEESYSGGDYSQTYDCEVWGDDGYPWHMHTYTNNGGPYEDYYLGSVIARFRIYLDDDFIENVDLNDLMCSTPSELVSCDGGSSSDDGGIEIELNLESRGDDGNYIQWSYGVDNWDDAPILPGINEYDAEDGGGDTWDEEDRTFGEVVSFSFTDDVEDGDSATTTSSIQILHRAYDKEEEEWIDIEDTSGTTGWHWNTHTVTINTDYICEEEIYCEDLDMTPTSLTAEEAEDTVEVIATSVVANDGTDWEDAEDFAGYKFWANDITGSLSDGVFTTYSWQPAITGDNPHTTNSNTAYYKNGEAGDTIYVCAVNEDGDCLTPDYIDDYPGDCIAAVTSTPTIITCNYMTMTPSGTQTAPGASYTQDITIETYDTTGDPWYGTADWILTCNDSASINPPSPTDTNTTVTYTETDQAESETCCVTATDQIANWCMAQVCFVREAGPSDDVTPDDVTPDDVTPDDVTPDDVTPDDVTPDDVTPDDVTPGDDDVTPGDDDVTPGDDDVTPGDDDVTPGDDDVTPGDDDVTPEYPTPGEIEKDVWSFNFTTDETGVTGSGRYYDSGVLAHDKDYLYYTITYTAEDGDSAVIEDNISDRIYGYMDDGPTSSYVDYESGSFTINIPQCTDPTDTSLGPNPCYLLSDSSNPLEGVELYNLSEGDVIEITYTGLVESYLNCDNPEDNICLAEYFENTATAQVTGIGEIEDSRIVTVICPYILTRNAGDVYIENKLEGSMNIACVAESDFANADGIILAKEDIAATLAEALNEFSSYIKELFYTVKNEWVVALMEATTKSRIARETYNYQTASMVTSDVTISNWNDLAAYKNINNPEENIYYIEGHNLIINGDLIVPEGAHTIVVENGNLKFDSNITYTDTYFGFNYYTYDDPENLDTANLPSLGIIVINGNMEIDSSVTDLVGAYYVEGGSITSIGSRDPIGEQLRIYGSVYGDIDDLIADSNFVGPPELDHGAIVIRYDERVILNTPPGLSEYIDFSSEEVAR